MNDGTHDDITIVSAEISAFGSNGKEGVGCLFENEDGDQISGVLWLTTDKAIARAEQSLRYSGWGGDWNDLSGVGKQPVQIVVATENDRQQVKWVNANHSRGGGGKALAGDAHARLMERLGAKPKEKTAEPAAPAAGWDEDIPF